MSPVRSRKQAVFLAIHHPDILHRWQREQPRDLAKLPDRAKRPSGTSKPSPKRARSAR